MFEYVHEGFVRGDCASGYVSQILQDLFEVFGYEVAGQVGVEAFYHFGQAFVFSFISGMSARV